MQLQTLLENKIGDHPSLPAAVVSSLLAAIFMMYPQAWSKIWPGPTRTKKIALLAEKLVKNGPKSTKIGGPNWPVAKKGQPEPDPGQKRPARTRPGPEKK